MFSFHYDWFIVKFVHLTHLLTRTWSCFISSIFFRLIKTLFLLLTWNPLVGLVTTLFFLLSKDIQRHPYWHGGRRSPLNYFAFILNMRENPPVWIDLEFFDSIVNSMRENVNFSIDSSSQSNWRGRCKEYFWGIENQHKFDIIGSSQ